MHDLPGRAITNAPDALTHDDFVTTFKSFLCTPLGFRHMIPRLAITVARIEHTPLGVIELKPRPGEDVLTHGAHQLHVEVNVVQPK